MILNYASFHIWVTHPDILCIWFCLYPIPIWNHIGNSIPLSPSIMDTTADKDLMLFWCPANLRLLCIFFKKHIHAIYTISIDDEEGGGWWYFLITLLIRWRQRWRRRPWIRWGGRRQRWRGCPSIRQTDIMRNLSCFLPNCRYYSPLPQRIWKACDGGKL